MSYATKNIKVDAGSKPPAQIFNTTIDDYVVTDAADAAVSDGSSSGSQIALLKGLQVILGAVAASPTANTIGDRLKTLATLIGEVQASPTANTLLARIKLLEGYLDGLETALGTTTDAAATGDGSLIAIVKQLRTILTDVWVDAANGLNIIPRNSSGTEIFTTANPAAVSLTGSTVTDAQASYIAGMGYNGATYDRWRNNIEGTILASAARITSTASANQTNYNARGVLIGLSVSVASGTGGLSVIVKGINPITGTAYFLNASPTAIIATGQYVYEVYPGSSTAGAAGSNLVNQRTSSALPKTWIAYIFHADGSSYTYSVSYQLIL